jgi:hypothetical protein
VVPPVVQPLKAQSAPDNSVQIPRNPGVVRLFLQVPFVVMDVVRAIVVGLIKFVVTGIPGFVDISIVIRMGQSTSVRHGCRGGR